MSTLLTSPQPQNSTSHLSVILIQVSNYVPSALQRQRLHWWVEIKCKLEQDLPSAGLGREEAACLPKQGVPVQLNKPLCAPSLLPPVEVLTTGGHVWAPSCHPHSERHKALLSQGSGCTQILLMVSPKAHGLALSPKLHVWKECFMGASLLTPHCPQACTQLQPGGHGYSCSFTANCGGVPWPLHFLSSTRNFGLWVLDSPSRGLALCPAFPAVPLGTPRILSCQQSMDVLSREMPGAQLRFSSSWSLHTIQHRYCVF